MFLMAQGKRGEQKRETGKRGSRGGFTRFFINLGKTDDLRPVNIIGMINDYTNVRNIDIGEIDIKKTFSFFEADKRYTDDILKGFQGKSFKKRNINLEVAERSKNENRSFSGRDKKRRVVVIEPVNPREKQKRRKRKS